MLLKKLIKGIPEVKKILSFLEFQQIAERLKKIIYSLR